jgi:hypothetical protein
MLATATPAIVASRSSKPRNDRSAEAGVEASDVDMNGDRRWTGPCAVLKRADHTGAARIVLTAAEALVRREGDVNSKRQRTSGGVTEINLEADRQGAYRKILRAKHR